MCDVVFKEALIEHFCTVFRQLDACISVEHRISGLRLAFPGPFDYENGISLLQGLDKYDTLYKVNLREELCKHLPEFHLCPNEIKFINDAAAFALGEMNFGNAAHTPFHLCLHRYRLRQCVRFGQSAASKRDRWHAYRRLHLSFSLFGQLHR